MIYFSQRVFPIIRVRAPKAKVEKLEAGVSCLLPQHLSPIPCPPSPASCKLSPHGSGDWGPDGHRLGNY